MATVLQGKLSRLQAQRRLVYAQAHELVQRLSCLLSAMPLCSYSCQVPVLHQTRPSQRSPVNIPMNKMNLTCASIGSFFHGNDVDLHHGMSRSPPPTPSPTKIRDRHSARATPSNVVRPKPNRPLPRPVSRAVAMDISSDDGGL